VILYLAGRYGRREELAIYAHRLRNRGHIVTSRWLDLTYPEDPIDIKTRCELADRDLEDLRAAEVLISFTEPSDSVYGRGGRHVEFGIALALGKTLHVVGHRENVFCCMDRIIFWNDVEDLICYSRLWPGGR